MSSTTSRLGEQSNVRRLIWVAITLLIPAFCVAQEAPAKSTAALANHPKIGLVLEGGAALGLAHIGVISWLEEHHIPVSYVAGTSMGGLIGGMYATGKSPAEMRQLVDQIPWGEVLRGETPFRPHASRIGPKVRHAASSSPQICGVIATALFADAAPCARRTSGPTSPRRARRPLRPPAPSAGRARAGCSR